MPKDPHRNHMNLYHVHVDIKSQKDHILEDNI